MSIKLKPLDDRIVVKRLDSEDKTAGGILLPSTAKEKPQQGKVLAVGPGKLLDSGSRAALDVKVGDTVVFGKYSGAEITVDGEEIIVLKESDVLAVVK